MARRLPAPRPGGRSDRRSTAIPDTGTSRVRRPPGGRRRRTVRRTSWRGSVLVAEPQHRPKWVRIRPLLPLERPAEHYVALAQTAKPRAGGAPHAARTPGPPVRGGDLDANGLMLQLTPRRQRSRPPPETIAILRDERHDRGGRAFKEVRARSQAERSRIALRQAFSTPWTSRLNRPRSTRLADDTATRWLADPTAWIPFWRPTAVRPPHRAKPATIGSTLSRRRSTSPQDRQVALHTLAGWPRSAQRTLDRALRPTRADGDPPGRSERDGPIERCADG